MSEVICTIKNQEFSDKARQLGLSEDALDRIVHEYRNTVGTQQFPSDSYIRAQFAISNIVSPEDYDALMSIWTNEFSQPIIVDNIQEAITIRDKAARYFNPNAIAIKPLQNGTLQVTIAAPRKPSISTSQPASKGPIVYNEEQEAAIDAAVKHINAVRSGRSKQKFFTIQGKAGTGKTTIVNEILNRMERSPYSTPVVLMGALSHKATSVLASKVKANGFNIVPKTIAGMLGMRPTNEGSFEPVPGKVPPIRNASVVIIDEASMVNEEQLELIQNAIKDKSVPIIFLGDIGQLPPVRSGRYYERRSISSEAVSPVFADESIPNARLMTRVRQGEDSPVLEYADQYWDFSQGKRENYPNDLKSKSRVTDKGALIVQRNEVDLVKQLLPLFEEAKRTGNPNLVKIVPYTTNSSGNKESAVDRYNRLIRKALYPNLDTDGFVSGDLIIFNETYGDENSSIPNSFESAVLSTRPCESALPLIEGVDLEEVEREYITFRTPWGTTVVPALIPTRENRTKHQRNLAKIAKYCRSNPRYWPKFWEYKNLYAANVDYAYAIDSHKSQGSTYDVVAVDAADINSVQPTTLKTKAQSIYTGLTRASNITIVSSNTTNEGTIYTDIKGINDRINAAKNGATTDESYTPKTEEDYFSEVTEDDIDKLIHDPNKKKQQLKKRGNIEKSSVNSADEKASVKSKQNYTDEKVDFEGDDWDSDLEGEDEEEDDDDNNGKEEEETLSAQEQTYRDFVAKQKQLNSIITFKRKTHTYTVNGRQADFSVTQFKDFVFGTTRTTNDFLEISSRLGNTHDTFLRDYFADDVKSSYPNLNQEQIKKLKIQAAKFKSLLEKTYGEDAIFITDEDLLKVAATVHFDGKDYVVAGTMDMVVIDNKGKIHIIDFKTHRANISEELSQDSKEEYAFQVSMYKAFQAANPLFRSKLGKTQIAQFNLRYADPRSNEYSFEKDQIYIEIGGESVALQDAQKNGKVPYKAGVFTNTLLGLSADLEDLEIEISPLKTVVQQRAEARKVDEETTNEPQRYTANMTMFYGKQKREDIKAVSTFGAILEGKRTATTRHKNLTFWKKIKKGDIITFKDSNGKTVDVKVTVAPHKLTKDTDPEEWSKKEGWSIEYYNKEIKPLVKRGEAWQVEYEVIRDTPKSIEVNSKSKKYALLSNFGDKEFEVDGKTFPTVEHYFQWAKAIHCKDYAMANRIKKATSAKQAKYLGSHELNMSKEQQKSWDKFSRKVMKKGMREAFEQNDEAKDLLLSTGTAELTHYLGGPFADVLMELREEFGGAGKPTTIKEAEKKAREDAKKSKEVPMAPKKKRAASNSQFIESEGDYPQRTKENAEWSDITLDLTESDKGSGGRNELTKRVAGNKYVHFKLTDEGDNTYDADEILAAIEEAGLPTENIKLNIAGSEIGKLKNDQEIYNEEVTRLLKGLQELGVTISEIRSGGQTGIDEAGIIAAQRLGIKWSVNAPKGWKFRDAKGVDHEGEEEAFKARFGSQANEWTRRGDKQFKISTEGYRKEDPKNNPDVAYVFTENAQAASSLYEGAQGYASEVEARNPKLKLTVSDVKGTNQAGIRMGSDGKAYPNTYGIVVKKRQQDEDGNWLSKEGQFEDTDEDFEIFKEFNNFFFDRLDEAPQKKIIFPSQMAYKGKAALPKRFAEWLAEELKTRYGVISTVRENENDNYEGYGLSIDSIQEKKVDSSLHVEKISDRYTPKTSSDVEQLNTAAEALRKQGWHVEFYSKKSRESKSTTKAPQSLEDTVFNPEWRVAHSKLLHKESILNVINTNDGLEIELKPTVLSEDFLKENPNAQVLIVEEKGELVVKVQNTKEAVYPSKSEQQKVIDTFVPKELQEYINSGGRKKLDKSYVELAERMRNENPDVKTSQIVDAQNKLPDRLRDEFGIPYINTATGETNYQGEKASTEPAYTNDVMTISIEGNPKKGFFELVKDQEEGNYSVHFKTKSKKAMNDSEFAEEALEDSEKEDMFKALIYAIPEGGTVSTWGTLSKGGISALDNLARRSGGALQKIGDKLAKDSEGNDTRIPVYKKLTEDEIAANNIARINKAKAVRKESKLPEFSGEYYGLEQSTEKSDMYTGIFSIDLKEVYTSFTDKEGKERAYSTVDITDGSKNGELLGLIKSLPYSSVLSLNTDVVNANFLYTLDELLRNPTLHAKWGKDTISIDPDSAVGMVAKEYARVNKNFPYNPKTGELRIPKFTVGYTFAEIQKRAAYNKLINNDLLSQEQLRALSKATMYKLSEFITMIQSYKNGYEKLFGKASDKDFTQMSRIDIIKEIGIKTLLLKVRERVFDSEQAEDSVPESTIEKMDVIFENWDAFVELGYDTLIGLEEIALDDGENVKNDLNDNIEDEDESVIQELFGNSIEHWQVGFRQVSAFSSLSKMIKRTMDSLYTLDENGNQINDEFGIAKHLDAQEAVSKILHFTQGAQSLDARNAEGNLLENSMLYMLKKNVAAEPWLQQVIDLLEDKYNDEGELISKADEQFKAQFYSNFKKYFQKYAITFKDKKGAVLIKIINESQYSDNLLSESQARENSFALGHFKLKNKDGSINQETLKQLKDTAKELEGFADKAESKGKLSELLDLNKYHKTLKRIFELLDISMPADEALYNLFSVKKNLKDLNRHLSYLKDNIKDGVSVTDNRDYKQIVALLSKEMGLEMESVSYEAGKMYYSYVLPSYLGRLTTKLKKDNMSDEEYDEFLQKEYLRYKWFNKDGKVRCRWLDRLRRSKDARENFTHVTSLHYLGTEYSAKTPVEYIASMMRMYFFDNNKKWAYFRVPMLSNKPSEEYIKFERIAGNYQDTITRYMWDVFTQECDRIQAVRQRRENTTKDQRIVSKGKKTALDSLKEGEESRGSQFVYEDYLQKYLDGTYSQRLEYEELTEEEQNQEKEFSRILKDFLDGKIEEESKDYGKLITLFNIMTKRGFEENYQLARQQWVDEGFITLNGDGTIKKVFNDMKLSEDDLREFFWNDAFAAIQILELTVTDIAYAVDTEDLQKRLAQLHAPGMQANINAKDKKGNLYTKDGIERTMYVKDNIIKSSMLANLKIAREQIIADTPIERRAFVAAQLDGIIKAFAEVNFADAQGYSCPSSYRKKMGIFGNWDDRMEDAYQKVTHPELYPDVNLSDMLDVLWQPLKPFVYTQIAKPGYNDILPELKVPVQNKNSEYVLVIADALLQRAGLPNKLRAIYEFMEESQHNADGTLNGEGIDTVQFMSAVNMGCSGVIDLNDITDKDGNVTHYRTEEEIKEILGRAYTFDEQGNRIYSPDYVHEIPFEDYIIQQNVPDHFLNHQQAHGSQDRILTFADILDVNPKTGETNYLVIDGEKISVAEAKKNYFQAIADNIEDSKQELIRRFKLNLLDPNDPNYDPRAANVAISKVLKDTILKDSRYGSDLLWACDTDEFGEFNIPLSDPIQSNRIQQLLNSVIKNTINKQEIAGGPLVQVSSWGTSSELNIRFKTGQNKLLLTEKEFNELKSPFPNEQLIPYGYRNRPDKWESADEAETYEEYIGDQAGVAYFESMIPIPDENFAKDFMKKDKDGNEYIDVEEIERTNPDMLYMIGYRIPTESKYSMIPIKVVGFLPRVGGEGIMLPADITSLAGSDFDIDKDYIMKMVFNRIEKDGKVTYEKPKEGRVARNNLIVATQLAVLRSEQVQKQLFTPGNFDEPKKYGYLISYVQNEAKRTGKDPQKIWDEAMKESEGKSADDFNDWLKKKNKTSKNLIFNNVQVQFHKQNMTAGKLIGIFAQANVSHAFISLVEDTTLNIPEELAFTINGHRVEGQFTIDNILTRDKSVNISNNLAALLAASVDAVKDPILNLININIDTANIVTAMIRMGFSLETVSLLVSQPIIVDLIRDYSIQNANGWVDMSVLIDSYLENMPEDIQQIQDISVTTDDLIANLNGDSAVTNYMVLKIFDRMRSIADTFGDITHMTRYNSITSAVGPFASDSMVQRIKDEAFESNSMIGTKVREACDNPILWGFRDSSNFIERQLLGKNLIQAGDKFERILEVLGKRLGYSRGVPSKVANAFSDFYMSFYVNAGPDGSVFNLGYENRKYMLTQFPRDFLRIKNKYKDNILVNSIQYTESDREEFGFLRLKTRGLNSTVMEDMKQAWISLYEGDEDSRALALRLAEYNYFRGSFGFSPKTFMNLTPNVVKSNLPNYISVLNSKNSLVETTDMTDRIINQFILHNTKLVIDKYRHLEDYDPTILSNEAYGEVIQLERKPEGKKKVDELITRRPIIKIDNNFYYVLPGNNDPTIAIVKKVDALGGDGQGFEISTEIDFPETIFDSDFIATKKDGKDRGDGSYSRDRLSEESVGVLIEQLFEDDGKLEEILSMSAKDVIKELNKELSSRGITKQVSNRNKNMVGKLLTRLEGISNPREVLNKTEKTISDEGFCN